MHRAEASIPLRVCHLQLAYLLHQLVVHVDAAIHAGQTKSLIIVAPPRALGVLRQSYSHELRNALRAEIDKDLVKMPVHEIEKHLAA